jgi:outer membrane receptor protein involved in Fe transport
LDAVLAYVIPRDRGGPLSGLRMSVSGRNLFDRSPNIVLNGVNAIDLNMADEAIGRTVSLEISKEF